MSVYLVRTSFGELEFTSCEINHLHIGAKPAKKKTQMFKLLSRSANEELIMHVST
jgi:hypothetical protein